MYKKILSAVFTVSLVLSCLPAHVSALDFSLRARPFMFFPTGDSADLFELGGGGDLLFDLDLSSVFPTVFGIGYSAGIEGGISIVSPQAEVENSLQIGSGGFGLSLFYYPLSRLSVRADGAFGLYKAVFGDNSTSSSWWRFGGEAGFRFTPAFTLAASGGYRAYNNKGGGGDLLSGIYAGLAAQINFETGKSAGSVDVIVQQDEAIFPLFLSLYQQTPAANLIIINNESAEIRNVRVSFRAEAYTASEFECGGADIIRKRASIELPLLADFSGQALNLTENSRIAGELIIRYEMLGSKRTIVRSAAVSVYNRNSFRWTDPQGLAALVSPTSPETLEFAKRLTGLARSNLFTGINRNIQFGMYLLEGLGAAGIGYSPTVPTPYAQYRASAEEIDTVQFPFQTLSYRIGDLDDLGLVYAALLEASGIRSALIPLDDDFLVALSTGLNEKASESNFNSKDNLLIINDEVWIPLSIADMKSGFMGSWDGAIKKLNTAFVAGSNVDFIIVEDAWTTYPSAALPPQNLPPAQAAEADVVKAVNADVKGFISAEIEPRIRALSAQIGSNGTTGQYNQLGLLYLRSGNNTQARSAFEKAAAMNSTAAMLNLGNLLLVMKDPAGAERWFNRVLQLSPDNAAAKKGLAQAALDK